MLLYEKTKNGSRKKVKIISNWQMTEESKMEIMS